MRSVRPDRATSPKSRATNSIPRSRAWRFTLIARSGKRRASATTARISPMLSGDRILARMTEAIASRRCSIDEPIAATHSMVVLARTMRATTAANNASLLPYRA